MLKSRAKRKHAVFEATGDLPFATHCMLLFAWFPFFIKFFSFSFLSCFAGCFRWASLLQCALPGQGTYRFAKHQVQQITTLLVVIYFCYFCFVTLLFCLFPSLLHLMRPCGCVLCCHCVGFSPFLLVECVCVYVCVCKLFSYVIWDLQSSFSMVSLIDIGKLVAGQNDSAPAVRVKICF